MAKIVIITASQLGDQVTIRGTVDDVPVTVQVWRSHLDTLSPRAQKVAYVASELKAAAPSAPVAIDLAATVTM